MGKRGIFLHEVTPIRPLQWWYLSPCPARGATVLPGTGRTSLSLWVLGGTITAAPSPVHGLPTAIDGVRGEPKAFDPRLSTCPGLQ